MNDRRSDAHAYVDGCLPQAERAAFEAAMIRNPRLRVRVEAWRAQNEAILTAFGVAPRARVAPPPAGASSPSRSQGKPKPAPRRPFPRALAAALAGLAALLAPTGGPADPRAQVAARAEAALRALALQPAPALDFVSGDAGETARWLAGRLPGLGAGALRAPGWTLLGVRVTPGLNGAAALVVFEDALGDRAGLWLERNDARPDRPARMEAGVDRVTLAGALGGLDYAVVGPRGSGAAALAPRAQPPL